VLTCFQALVVFVLLTDSLACIYKHEMHGVINTWICTHQITGDENSYSFSVYVKLPSIDGMGPDNWL
jgi:hypothetical protein